MEIKKNRYNNNMQLMRDEIINNKKICMDTYGFLQNYNIY